MLSFAFQRVRKGTGGKGEYELARKPKGRERRRAKKVPKHGRGSDPSSPEPDERQATSSDEGEAARKTCYQHGRSHSGSRDEGSRQKRHTNKDNPKLSIPPLDFSDMLAFDSDDG
jgi:hypothetical protein